MLGCKDNLLQSLPLQQPCDCVHSLARQYCKTCVTLCRFKWWEGLVDFKFALVAATSCSCCNGNMSKAAKVAKCIHKYRTTNKHLSFCCINVVFLPYVWPKLCAFEFWCWILHMLPFATAIKTSKLSAHSHQMHILLSIVILHPKLWSPKSKSRSHKNPGAQNGNWTPIVDHQTVIFCQLHTALPEDEKPWHLISQPPRPNWPN